MHCMHQLLITYLMSQSNCSLSSEQPKSVVQAWPMVNLWNFSMSMTPTWATAQPNSSGRWFTQAAGGGRGHSQTHWKLWCKKKKASSSVLLFRKGHTHTYEQAAIWASIYGQLWRRGVSLLDEILGCTLEVREAVLLVGQHSGWRAKWKRGINHLQITRNKNIKTQIKPVCVRPLCQVSPYSPPPRMLATAKTPLRCRTKMSRETL